jgi:uncharacterized coiled-coil protein SlyX
MTSVWNTLKCLLAMAGIFALVSAGVAIQEFRVTVAEMSSLVRETRTTVTKANVALDTSIAHLNDPKNQKSLDAAIQTAAVFNGTGRLINTVYLPKFGRVLDGLADTASNLNEAVRRTDVGVNSGLLPNANRLVVQSTSTMTESQKAVERLIQMMTQMSDDSHRLLTDPSIPASLTAIQASAENIQATTLQIAEASKAVPGIARNVEKISTTASKFRKWVLISQISTALVSAVW